MGKPNSTNARCWRKQLKNEKKILWDDAGYVTAVASRIWRKFKVQANLDYQSNEQSSGVQEKEKRKKNHEGNMEICFK